MLNKSYADLETQAEEYQARENQWSVERAALTDKIASLETYVKDLQDRVAPHETDNKGIVLCSSVAIVTRSSIIKFSLV